MTPPDPTRLEAIRDDMRCAVTAKRCGDFGCQHEGAHIMPRDWRCNVCRAWETLQTQAATIAELTAELKERG